MLTSALIQDHQYAGHLPIFASLCQRDYPVPIPMDIITEQLASIKLGLYRPTKWGEGMQCQVLLSLDRDLN